MALDFPNNPVQGQQATLTNGITYQYDGAEMEYQVGSLLCQYWW